MENGMFVLLLTTWTASPRSSTKAFGPKLCHHHHYLGYQCHCHHWSEAVQSLKNPSLLDQAQRNACIFFGLVHQ
jgi:hypothetical protein